MPMKAMKDMYNKLTAMKSFGVTAKKESPGSLNCYVLELDTVRCVGSHSTKGEAIFDTPRLRFNTLAIAAALISEQSG